MAIKDTKDFEEKLAQLCRYYRALAEIWGQTNASDEKQIVKWISAGGKTLNAVTEVLAEVEDYTGCSELRVICDNLKAERDLREKAESERPTRRT